MLADRQCGRYRLATNCGQITVQSWANKFTAPQNFYTITHTGLKAGVGCFKRELVLFSMYRRWFVYTLRNEIDFKTHFPSHFFVDNCLLNLLVILTLLFSFPASNKTAWKRDEIIAGPFRTARVKWAVSKTVTTESKLRESGEKTRKTFHYRRVN